MAGPAAAEKSAFGPDNAQVHHDPARFFCVLTTRAVPVSRDLAQYNLEARDTFNGNASDRDGYIHHAVTALRKEREQREAMARGEGGGKGGSALDQGEYAVQLEGWWKEWGKEAFLHVSYDSLVQNASDTLLRIRSFLGHPPGLRLPPPRSPSEGRNGTMAAGANGTMAAAGKKAAARGSTIAMGDKVWELAEEVYSAGGAWMGAHELPESLCYALQKRYNKSNARLYQMLRGAANATDAKTAPFPPFRVRKYAAKSNAKRRCLRA
eukprot:2664438-Rhodomonas_salina.2